MRILTEQEETDATDGVRYMTGLTERYVRVGIKDCGIPQNTFTECMVTGVTDQGILIGEQLVDPQE